MKQLMNRCLDWFLDQLPPPSRGVMQVPVSEERPPVPESMRHHFVEGQLDERGNMIHGELSNPDGKTTKLIVPLPPLEVHIVWPNDEHPRGRVRVQNIGYYSFERVNVIDAPEGEYVPGWWLFDGNYYTSDKALTEAIVQRVFAAHII